MVFPNQIHSLKTSLHSKNVLCIFSPELVSAYSSGVAGLLPEDNSFRPESFYVEKLLECQKDIFAVLSPEKQIGLTLTDSLLMSPSKSVTAFVGLGNTEKPSSNKCSLCEKTDCTLRGV